MNICLTSIKNVVQTRAADKIWFHVSGSPATHQCVQSIPLKALKLLTCASFLNWDNLVMLSNDTGFLIPLKTCSITISSDGMPPRYVELLIGSISFPQFVTPVLFHSAPLKISFYIFNIFKKSTKGNMIHVAISRKKRYL